MFPSLGFLVLLGVWALKLGASQQITGAISGTVKDAQGAVAGVVGWTGVGPGFR